MKTQWHIKDLIDLEYFLHMDRGGINQRGRTDVDARDRQIYLKNIQPHLTGSPSIDRRFVIKSWL
ncbi:MAG: hypothetical protein DSY90_04315, partial [Deltaproteobacteria bacterium]